jgi:hypothetical protein
MYFINKREIHVAKRRGLWHGIEWKDDGVLYESTSV